MHILLVEDDESLYNLYSTEFDLNGHSVAWHKVGSGVIDKIKAEKPDAVLLDIMLPEKTGFEILKEVKVDEEIKNIPIIMLTNFGTQENVHEAIEEGAEDFIMKHNVVPEEIVEKVEEIVNG